jgi:hypothetical protein
MNTNVFCNKCHRTPSQCLCRNAPKELSDEEIYKLAEYHGLNDWLYETSVPDFARAILKKASEK